MLMLCVLAALGIPRADGPDIVNLAPRSTTRVARIPDVSALIDRAREGPLDAFWTDDELNEYAKGLLADAIYGMAWQLDRETVPFDELAWPKGHLGIAWFPGSKPEEDPEPAEPVEPEAFDFGPPPVPDGFIIVAEFGDEIEKFDALSGRLFAGWADEGLISIEHEVHEGVDIQRLVAAPPEDAEEVEEQFGYIPPGFLGAHGSIAVAEHEGIVIASSDLGALHHAIEALKGEDIDALADNPTLERTLAQHPAGSVVQMVGLISPDDWNTITRGFAFFFPFDMEPFFEVLGLNEIAGGSVAIHVGGEGVAEATFGAIVPEKKGLVELFSTGKPFEPPAFFGPDVLSLVQMNIDFGKIPDLILRAVESLPEDQREQARAGAQEALNFIRPLVETMGMETYLVQGLALPFTPESQKSVFVLRLTDDLVASNLLTTFAAPAGVTPRDFGGNTIFSPEDEAMGPSIGLGFGHAFIGPASAVESLMRLAGDAAGAKLADEPAFAAARDHLRPSPVLAWYQDGRQTLSWTAWSGEHFGDVMYDLYYGGEQDPEFPPPPREETVREFNETKPAYLANFPDPRKLGELFESVAMDIVPTAEGFSGRLVILPPKD